MIGQQNLRKRQRQEFTETHQESSSAELWEGFCEEEKKEFEDISKMLENEGNDDELLFTPELKQTEGSATLVVSSAVSTDFDMDEYQVDDLDNDTLNEIELQASQLLHKESVVESELAFGINKLSSVGLFQAKAPPQRRKSYFANYRPQNDQDSVEAQLEQVQDF
jgi:hypothetical protein